jgi:cyclin H
MNTDDEAVNANAFTVSTHARNWLFQTSELLQQRQMIPHKKACDRVISLTRTNDGNLIADKSKEPSSSSSQSTPNISPLTLSDEKQLILYYILTMSTIAAKFTPPLPDRVQHTAITYLKRFYLNYSCMDYHPMKILITCTLLACKIEEHYVSPQRLAEKLSTSPGQLDDKVKEIVKLEVPVLEGIEFNLKVFHPHRAIRGLVRQLQQHYKTESNDQQTNDMEAHIAAIHQHALQYCNFVYRTDATFLATHSQLALIAIVCAAHSISQTKYVDRYVTNDLTFNNLLYFSYIYIC